MRLNHLFIFILSSFLLSSCSSTKETFWVSGIKTECTKGADKIECLNIYKGDNLNKAVWENFYSTIKGFEYNPAYLQKIKVKKEIIKAKNIPTDGSNLKYTLIKVLDKKIDKRLLAKGNWILSEMGNYPIDKIKDIPNLTIKPKEKKVLGNGGCNNYSGELMVLGQNKMQIGALRNSLMECSNKNIEPEYLQLIEKVAKYDVDTINLKLYDQEGRMLMSFQKVNTPIYQQQINDIWNLEKIEGQLVDNKFSRPRLEISVRDMIIMGNDGCSKYKAKIVDLTKNKISFSPLASSRNSCPNIEISNRFSELMKRVSNYQINELHLTFTDESGNLLLQFLKGD